MKNSLNTLILCLASLGLFISCHAAIPSNLALQQVFTTNSFGSLTARHSGDGTGRLFIVDKSGKIEIWDGGSTTLATPFLDISAKILSGGEQGLLGLDFDPGFVQNGYFYVNYTKSGSNSGDTVIERYQVSNNPNIADPNSGQIIMRIAQPFTNHNGGNILFGPDAFLYIGTGDGGSFGDPNNNAQNLSSMLGKMLRIDVSNVIYTGGFEAPTAAANTCGLDSVAGSYKIPADNPFINTASDCSEIWSYGLRNPWRWSFDKLTGDLIIGDVGQNAYEEIDFQPAASTGGENYGWRCREGAHNYDTSQCSNGTTFVEPVIDLPQSFDGGCSVMGGYVYRGPITAIYGKYIFSDYCHGKINFATIGAGTWPYENSTGIPNVGTGTQSFGEDEAGNIYHLQGNTVSKIIQN